jgi:4a-hydroxytetrahydrobiopterin dehydratase
MNAWITPAQFHAASGIDDWRVLASGVATHLRTGTWSTAVELVDAIAALADAEHHPDLDLRGSGVTVRIAAGEVNGFAQHDIERARRLSAAAGEFGVSADPLAAGGHLVSDAHAPAWRVLADAEGNEVCVATGMGRD